MIQKTLIILFVILSVNSILVGQKIKFTDFKNTQLVRYSNFEKIEREMQRAVEEKRNKIVAIYRMKIPYNDTNDKGFEVKKNKIVIFVMLYTVTPFEVLNRVDFIWFGDQKYVADQGTIFPDLSFSEKEFNGIQDGVEIFSGNGKFGKIDKKMIDKFPIVKVKERRG